MNEVVDRLLFLDFRSFLLYLAAFGLASEELGQMLCVGFRQHEVIATLRSGMGREAYLADLQKILEDQDQGWAATWLDFAIACWVRATERGQVSSHHPNERWLWSPLNDLLCHHGMPALQSLAPPVAPSVLGPDALENAQRYYRDYSWAAARIRHSGLPLNTTTREHRC